MPEDQTYARINNWLHGYKWEYMGKWVAFVDGVFVGADEKYSILFSGVKKEKGVVPIMIKITPWSFPH